MYQDQPIPFLIPQQVVPDPWQSRPFTGQPVQQQPISNPVAPYFTALQQGTEMEGARATAARALQAVQLIYQYSLATFDLAAGQMLAQRDQPGRTPEHQALVEAATNRRLQALERDLAVIETVGVVTVGMMVGDSANRSRKR